MASCFGRKIFFLNPTYSVKKDIVSDLEKNEYEVYVIENYRDAKNLLMKNPDSILFINADAQLSVGAWYNFVRTLERDETLATTITAIMTERMKQSDKDLFVKTAHLRGGIIDFDDGLSSVAKKINEVLLAFDAKGRRQYVRANLVYDRDASLFWNHGSKMHQLKLLDISSVGMAVKIPKILENQIIVKNFLLNGGTLRLGTRQLVVDTVVYAVKQSTDCTIWVLLLMPGTSPTVKDEIRHYVTKTMHETLLLSINGDRKDESDYNLLNYYNLATKQKPMTTASKSTFVSPFSHIPGFNG